jgi:hypothetical protein
VKISDFQHVLFMHIDEFIPTGVIRPDRCAAVFNVNPNDMRMLSVEARPFFPLQLRRLFDMPAFPHQVCVCSSGPCRLGNPPQTPSRLLCDKRGKRRFILSQEMIFYHSEGVWQKHSPFGNICIRVSLLLSR